MLFMLVFTQAAKCQCPNLLDGGGLPRANPVFINCPGTDFDLFVEPVDILFTSFQILDTYKSQIMLWATSTIVEDLHKRESFSK